MGKTSQGNPTERCAEILSQNNKGNQVNNGNQTPNPESSTFNPPQSQASANLTEVEPDEDTNAFMLASIDAYLTEQHQAQEEEDSDRQYEVWGCGTCIIPENEETTYPTIYLSSQERHAC